MVRTAKSEKPTTAPIEEKKSKSKKAPVAAPAPAPAAAPENEVVAEPVAEDSVVFI